MLTLAIAGLLVIAQGIKAESAQRFGVGVNYWTMLDNVDVKNIDDKGLSWLVTYQYKPASLLKLEADLEVFPKGFQGIDDNAFAPEAYLILGSGLYAGVGAGILYAHGDFAQNPFYALRAGIDLNLFAKVYLDLNVIYRFQDWTALSDMAHNVNSDSLMLGAAIRMEF